MAQSTSRCESRNNFSGNFKDVSVCRSNNRTCAADEETRSTSIREECDSSSHVKEEFSLPPQCVESSGLFPEQKIIHDVQSFRKQVAMEGATQKILFQFDCLMNKLKIGLEGSDLTTPQIVTLLESIANCDLTGNHDDKSFANVFMDFRQHVQFHHYKMLLEVTHRLIPMYSEDVKEYVGKLRTYVSNRTFPLSIVQHPVSCPSDNNQKILVVKLDRELESFTDQDLEEAKKNIAFLLNMSENSLTLQTVTRGCVRLQFEISKSDCEKIASLRVTRSLARGLDEAGIIYIQSDTLCVFDNAASHLDQSVVLQPIQNFAGKVCYVNLLYRFQLHHNYYNKCIDTCTVHSPLLS